MNTIALTILGVYGAIMVVMFSQLQKYKKNFRTNNLRIAIASLLWPVFIIVKREVDLDLDAIKKYKNRPKN